MLQQLKKPELYERTAQHFWQHTYISQQLLKAHLDPDSEGASRRASFIEKSANWIGEKVSPVDYPSLLDFGCGPGLYTEKFAKLGYHVTGVDFSERSVQYAKKSADDKGLVIDYHIANYLEVDLHKQFDFITLIYCDYGALNFDERRQLLVKVTAHLRPGGKFLLDVFTPNQLNSFVEGQTWTLHSEGGFWRQGEHLTLSRNVKYGDNITLAQTTIVTDEEVTTYNIWNTCFTKESFIAEVKAAGFQVVEVFGDIAGSPYTEDSEIITLLLEKE